MTYNRPFHNDIEIYFVFQKYESDSIQCDMKLHFLKNSRLASHLYYNLKTEHVTIQFQRDKNVTNSFNLLSPVSIYNVGKKATSKYSIGPENMQINLKQARSGT